MSYISKEKEINLLHSESEKMYRRLVEDLRMGVFMADVKGNLFYVNNAFVQIIGYQNRDEVLGLNLASHLCVNPQDEEDFLKSMEKTGFVRDYIIKNKRKDGSIVELSVTSNYIRNQKEVIIGVEGIVEDITAKKKAEEESKVLTSAIKQTADHVMITDREGTVQYVNPAFEITTGYTQEEIVGKTPKILKSGRHGQEYYERLWSTILSGMTFYAQTTNKNKMGEMYVADQTISSIKDEHGKIINFVSVWKDITVKSKIEEQLKSEKMKLEEIVGFDEKVSRIRKLDKLIDFVVSKTAKILEAEKCSLMLLDDYLQKLCIKGCHGIKHEHVLKTNVEVGDSFAGTVVQDGISLLVEDAHNSKEHREGTSHEYLGRSFIIVPLKLEDRVIGVINVANKISSTREGPSFNDLDLKILNAISREVAVAIENVRMYKALNYLSVTDPLTRIYNLRQFRKSLQHEINRIQRFPDPLSLMIIDVDDFKSYNDTYGHLEGDELLKKIAEILTKSFREIDIVCRYAGDEFAVVLPHTDVPGAKIAAEKLIEKISNYKFKRKVTLSVGLTQWADKMNGHYFIQKADRALYQAKEEGKNRVCCL